MVGAADRVARRGLAARVRRFVSAAAMACRATAGAVATADQVELADAAVMPWWRLNASRPVSSERAQSAAQEARAGLAALAAELVYRRPMMRHPALSRALQAEPAPTVVAATMALSSS